MQIFLLIPTAGLAAATSDQVFNIEGDSPSAMASVQPFTLTLTVRAPADPSTSYVYVVGRPQLNKVFNGIHVVAMDSDSLQIEVDDNEAFEVNMYSHHDRNTSYACAILWNGQLKVYVAECSIPEIDYAGEWGLEALLNGESGDGIGDAAAAEDDAEADAEAGAAGGAAGSAEGGEPSASDGVAEVGAALAEAKVTDGDS